MNRVFERGDIIYLDLNPTLGKEQKCKRIVLTLTIRDFNKFGLILVAPITTEDDFTRLNGFSVPLLGTAKTRGVIITNQIRILNTLEANYQFIEKCDVNILEEVLAKVQALVAY